VETQRPERPTDRAGAAGDRCSDTAVGPDAISHPGQMHALDAGHLMLQVIEDRCLTIDTHLTVKGWIEEHFGAILTRVAPPKAMTVMTR